METVRDQLLAVERVEDLLEQALSPRDILSAARELQRIGKYRESLKAFETLQKLVQGMEVNDDDSLEGEIRVEVAQCRYLLGDFDAAEDMARKALSSRGVDQDLAAYAVLSKIAISRFDFDAAYQYMAFIGKDPATSALVSCFLSLKQGDAKGMDASFKSILRHHSPRHPEYRTFLAFRALLTGDVQNALPMAKSVYDEQENLPPPLLMLIGEIFARSGSTAVAQKIFDRLNGVCPEHADLWFLEALIAEAEGNSAGAQQAAEEVLQQHPQHRDAKALLERLQVDEEIVSEQDVLRGKVLVLVFERV